jgi:epoxyqueuosine reductase
LQISAKQLQKIITPLCEEQQIDLAGVVALPHLLPHGSSWLQWIDDGMNGDLEYLSRDPKNRIDPTRKWEWAKTLIVFGQRYTNGWPENGNSTWLKHVSRYAWGNDYHYTLLNGIKQITSAVLTELDSESSSHCVTDTGPFLEREYAWLAGLGFTGKNTMLIHPKLGSGLFLGVALLEIEVTDLAEIPKPLFGSPFPIQHEPGPESMCGTCTACIDACPTDALDGSYTMDAAKCISTWTIEWHGRAPESNRHQQGEQLFGCDICQQVCPWNKKAARTLMTEPHSDYLPNHEFDELSLEQLMTIDKADFKTKFRRSPLWRAHPEGMRRNALVVAANSNRTDLVGLIAEISNNDPDEEVREVAHWALTHLGQALA